MRNIFTQIVRLLLMFSAADDDADDDAADDADAAKLLFAYFVFLSLFCSIGNKYRWIAK